MKTRKNSGPSKARNLGIEKSSGDYIFFIDSDDTIECQAILKLIEHTDSKTLCGIRRAHTKVAVEFIDSDDYINKILSGKENGFACVFLFRSFWVKKIYFDERTNYMEDTLFLINYLGHIQKICYLNILDARYIYTPSNNSITRNNERVFSNIGDFVYSLSMINEITNHRYEKIINEKKVVLIEKEGAKLSPTSENFNLFLTNSLIEKTINESKNTIFVRLYKLQSPILMKKYYQLRKISKNILNQKSKKHM